LLLALLTPNDELLKIQNSNNWTELMVRQEELKTMPFGDVWDYYCDQCGTLRDGEWFGEIIKYEQEVLKERGN
jgi:L-rhamnose isomerase